MFAIRDDRDAVVQEDFMKAVRKLNEAKKHETTMWVLITYIPIYYLECSFDVKGIILLYKLDLWTSIE